MLLYFRSSSSLFFLTCTFQRNFAYDLFNWITAGLLLEYYLFNWITAGLLLEYDLFNCVTGLLLEYDLFNWITAGLLLEYDLLKDNSRSFTGI
jgi:hypothetical protein